eukprot:PITA_35952
MDAKYVIAIFLCVLVSFVHGFHASDLPTPVEGLSWTFYEESCPNLKSIVKSILDEVLKQNITEAPGLLRLLFHDCFVQGCDASILLNGTSSEPSEQEATPNLTLRAAAFEIINEIKEAVEANCSGVVSCADILALAASYAVFVAGGPEFLVPLGRRDSLSFANQTVTDDNIPSPTSNVTVLMTLFTEKGFESFTDLVALSGAHTFGIGHCSAFVDRLYPTPDPTLNGTFAKELEQTCPTNSTVNTTHLDILTPYVFDEKYYVDLQNGEGLFTSDESLYNDKRTEHIVNGFALNQAYFFEHFALSMLKMVQLDVLTGSEGEIRKNCAVPNTNTSSSSYSILDIPVTSRRPPLHAMNA